MQDFYYSKIAELGKQFEQIVTKLEIGPPLEKNKRPPSDVEVVDMLYLAFRFGIRANEFQSIAAECRKVPVKSSHSVPAPECPSADLSLAASATTAASDTDEMVHSCKTYSLFSVLSVRWQKSEATPPPGSFKGILKPRTPASAQMFNRGMSILIFRTSAHYRNLKSLKTNRKSRDLPKSQ